MAEWWQRPIARAAPKPPARTKSGKLKVSTKASTTTAVTVSGGPLNGQQVPREPMPERYWVDAGYYSFEPLTDRMVFCTVDLGELKELIG